MIQGLGHITFSVSNMKRSIEFYSTIFNASPIVKGDKTTYFEVGGLWIALNLQKNISRTEIHESYSHIAFSVLPSDLHSLMQNLKEAHADIVQGRERNSSSEGESIYFRDPDGHLLEFHTGNLKQRLTHLQQTNPSILTTDHYGE